MRPLIAIPAIVLVLALSLNSRSAATAEVRREYLGLDLAANLELPTGRTVKDGPVAIIVHGTLGHHGLEIVRTLQATLKARGVASLGITLSLGLNARRGMFDCGLEHDHRASDAVDEIGAWVDWLKEQGVPRVTLIGHSRGAQQVLHYAASEPDAVVDRLLLAAPVAETLEQAAAHYAAAFGGDLKAILEAAAKLVEAGEDDTIVAAPGFLSCKSARVTAAALLDYYDPERKRSVLALAQRILRPVLIIAAGADTVSAGLAARVKAADLGANVELVTIAGADHFFQDLFADELADRSAAFMIRKSPASP